MAQVVTDEVIAPTDSPRVASSRSTRVWLAVILGLATLLRVLWVLHAARPTKALNDPFFYTVFGEQISQGRGYTLFSGEPTAFYPVGYPAVLGGAFWLMHHTFVPDTPARVIGFLQLILGVATVAARLRGGTPPVRRVHGPGGGGRRRPVAQPHIPHRGRAVGDALQLPGDVRGARDRLAAVGPPEDRPGGALRRARRRLGARSPDLTPVRPGAAVRVEASGHRVAPVAAADCSSSCSPPVRSSPPGRSATSSA